MSKAEGMVQILLMLKVLFCGAPSGFEPSRFFSDVLFGLEFEAAQEEF